MLRRLTPLAVCLVLSAISLAEVRYTVLPIPENNRVRVYMKFEVEPGNLELQMPNWAPGAYILSTPGRSVQDFKLADREGNPIPFEKVGDNTWKTTIAQGGTVQADYVVPAGYQNGAIHYTGPSTYLYIVGRKQESCRLSFSLKPSWNIAVGLDPVRGSKLEYTAPDYDVLADNPVTLGDFIELTYEAFGKPHFLAIRGPLRDRADQKALLDLCKFVSESQGKFFGGLPYRRYVWHLNITAGPGGGGLEHLTSTSISCGPNVTVGIVGLFAHEYFHLWNVKRIRSRVLGPFDYTELPKTGALYWLEGTTDYYASLLPFRDGRTTEKDFLDEIVSNTRAVRSNPAHLEVSPYEASMRVGEANNGRGNSNGYRISYYNLGWLVGLLLDIEIRAQTDGRRSLDDVMRALWAMCKDGKPGFEEDEIRKQCVRFGGEALGPFFDRVVMKPGPMPIEEQLAKVGLKMAEEQESYVDLGFDLGPVFRSDTIRVVRTRDGANGIEANDVVVAIGGEELKGENSFAILQTANRMLAELKVGSSTTIKVRRGGEEKEFKVEAKAATRPRLMVSEDPGADAAKKKLREGWYFAGKRR